MVPDPSTIFHSKWDQSVAPSMIGRHRVGGLLICLELHVFNLIGRAELLFLVPFLVSYSRTVPVPYCGMFYAFLY